MRARTRNRLSAVAVRALRKKGRHADGAGLFLVIGTSARAWAFRYTSPITGKVRDKGLGAAAEVSLERARQRAEACRQMLLNGVDPLEFERAERAKKMMEVARAVSFGDAAKQYISANEASWKSDRTKPQYETSLNSYASALMQLPVADVDKAAVINVLTPIWTRIPPTANRVRYRIEMILNWATVVGLRPDVPNPARWKGNLDKVFPEPKKVMPVKHHPALPYAEAAQFLKALRASDRQGARIVELQLQTATRSSEVASAEWAEFDLDTAIWTLPGKRTKTGKELKIPLAPDVVRMLREMPRGNPFLFPGPTLKKPIGIDSGLRTMEEIAPGYVPHGLRSCFRDFCADVSTASREVAEAALGHSIVAVEAAYRRTDFFDKRRRLMEEWSRYLNLPPSSSSEKVTSIAKARRS
jgi:integrase